MLSVRFCGGMSETAFGSHGSPYRGNLLNNNTPFPRTTLLLSCIIIRYKYSIFRQNNENHRAHRWIERDGTALIGVPIFIMRRFLYNISYHIPLLYKIFLMLLKILMEIFSENLYYAFATRRGC